MSEANLIIYKTADGQANIALYARDGNVWLTQAQMAELFSTSVPNISIHISNILEENELHGNSVVKDFLTTAADGKGGCFTSAWSPLEAGGTKKYRRLPACPVLWKAHISQ